MTTTTQVNKSHPSYAKLLAKKRLQSSGTQKPSLPKRLESTKDTYQTTLKNKDLYLINPKHPSLTKLKAKKLMIQREQGSNATSESQSPYDVEHKNEYAPEYKADDNVAESLYKAVQVSTYQCTKHGEKTIKQMAQSAKKEFRNEEVTSQKLFTLAQNIYRPSRLVQHCSSIFADDMINGLAGNKGDLQKTKNRLDVASLVGIVAPPVGVASDLTNAYIDGYTGDYQGMSKNLFFALPAIGDIAGAGKLLKGAKLFEAGKTGEKVLKGADITHQTLNLIDSTIGVPDKANSLYEVSKDIVTGDFDRNHQGIESNLYNAYYPN